MTDDGLVEEVESRVGGCVVPVESPISIPSVRAKQDVKIEIWRYIFLHSKLGKICVIIKYLYFSLGVCFSAQE